MGKSFYFGIFLVKTVIRDDKKIVRKYVFFTCCLNYLPVISYNFLMLSHVCTKRMQLIRKSVTLLILCTQRRPDKCTYFNDSGGEP